MAEKIQMPKLGNSVESCIIVEWLIKEGDSVSEGDILCVAETDKAAVDVESKHSGVILALLAEKGDEVPVYAPIAVIGEAGEHYDPVDMEMEKETEETVPVSDSEKAEEENFEPSGTIFSEEKENVSEKREADVPVSPRARNLAKKEYVDAFTLSGTGPGGRVIERDVEKAVLTGVSVSAAAREMAMNEGRNIPSSGSGIGGRVVTADLTGMETAAPVIDSEIKEIPVKGMRKIIADTMFRSLSTTAQFTAHTSADATKLLSLRKKFKESGDLLGLSGVTINDIVMYAVVKTLKSFPSLNAHFDGNIVKEFSSVHLGIAVDTKRGLLVPVLKNAERLSLKGLSDKAGEIYTSVENNSILPDDLSGSTFTVTNLGSLGIQCFTPVLNIPEVAILGICSIEQKPVLHDGSVVHRPHIGFSLTVNHQIIDGAPAARFLKSLCLNVENIDLVLSL